MGRPGSDRFIRKRFFQVLHDHQSKFNWNAKKMAKHHGIPYRTLRKWLTCKECPRPDRLRKICGIFKWNYEALFGKESMRDLEFEHGYLDFAALNRRYLAVQSHNPLEAWGYVSVAGAMVFNWLTFRGFECIAKIDHLFGTRIEFLVPKLATRGLKIDAVFGRGLVISWFNELGAITGEPRDLMNSALDFVEKELHSLLKS